MHEDGKFVGATVPSQKTASGYEDMCHFKYHLATGLHFKYSVLQVQQV